MMKVVLKTKDGGMVVDREIPDFVLKPEVILWGDRTFVLSDTSEGRANGDLVPVYTEAFAFAIVDLVEA